MAVALITGGARRIGAAMAKALHADGFDVVVHHHRSADAAAALVASLNAQRAKSAVAVAGVLDRQTDIEVIAAKALAAFGSLDVLVNNASSFYPTPVGSITEQDWDALFGPNLKAPLFLAQALAPALRKSGGCIVNMVDIHAQRPMGDHPVYCAAKAGLAMLTKSLAKELGPEVRVNGIAPGAILWPEAGLDDAQQQNILQRTALDRIGDPADIVGALRYLVSADYVTGQVVAVDGGRSLGW